VGVLEFEKEESNSRQPNCAGRAYKGVLICSCNIEPNAWLKGGGLRVQLLRRIQLLGLARYWLLGNESLFPEMLT
jgi:hypothetical protein